MRLASVRYGRRLVDRLRILKRRLWAPDGVFDTDRVMLYREDLFGRPYMAWYHAAMRGPSEWSVGERELIATFVSRRNGCRYCATAHGAYAGAALGNAALVRDAVAEPAGPSVEPRLAATLAFLEKLMTSPEALTDRDAAAAVAAGVSLRALEQALHICALFTVINKMADALGFEIPPQELLGRRARRIAAAALP
jgi:uncharacterized peroxidase-related enzyme